MSSIKANLQVAPQDVFQTSSTQGTDIGALATTGDGRIFRYAQAGTTALAAGKLMQASAQDATNLQNLGVNAAVAIGATSLTTGSSVTLTANQLAGAFMTVSKSTGLGQSYKISGNTAATAATCTFYLEDPIRVALASTTAVDIVPNPYLGVVVDPTTASSAPVGVSLTVVTASFYCWLQTHGPVGVLAQGTIAVGLSVYAANTGAAGAVAPTSGTQPVVGYALTDITTAEYGMVFLTID